MAMGTRSDRAKQEGMWIAQAELAAAPGHPFYERLNEVLEEGRLLRDYECRMLETGMSGLMSGDGKRDGALPSARARPRLYNSPAVGHAGAVLVL
jgi:hypothetical protein